MVRRGRSGEVRLWTVIDAVDGPSTRHVSTNKVVPFATLRMSRIGPKAKSATSVMTAAFEAKAD